MRIIAFLIIFSFVNLLHAQNEVQADMNKNIQPTIMVIPFAPKGVQLRDAYEKNELVRIAVTKVKEGFDSRGVNTIDLRGKLKQSANTAALQDGQEESDKDDVIRNSGADIYVEVEATKDKSSTGNSATVIMTAYDAFSGESFANKVSTSQKFYTDNFDQYHKLKIQ